MDGKGMELSDGLLTYLDWDWYVVDCFKEIRMIGYVVKTDDEDHPYSIIEFPHLVLDANEIRRRGHDYCREQQAKTTRWPTGYCDPAQVSSSAGSHPLPNCRWGMWIATHRSGCTVQDRWREPHDSRVQGQDGPQEAWEVVHIHLRQRHTCNVGGISGNRIRTGGLRREIVE